MLPNMPCTHLQVQLVSSLQPLRSNILKLLPHNTKVINNEQLLKTFQADQTLCCLVSQRTSHPISNWISHKWQYTNTMPQLWWTVPILSEVYLLYMTLLKFIPVPSLGDWFSFYTKKKKNKSIFHCIFLYQWKWLELNPESMNTKRAGGKWSV